VTWWIVPSPHVVAVFVQARAVEVCFLYGGVVARGAAHQERAPRPTWRQALAYVLRGTPLPVQPVECVSKHERITNGKREVLSVQRRLVE
jgi:hypothetical protein